MREPSEKQAQQINTPCAAGIVILRIHVNLNNLWSPRVPLDFTQLRICHVQPSDSLVSGARN